MFDVGFSELVLIGLIALIVLGPKRLPEVARTAGRWTARIRRFITDVKQDLDREMRHAELDELRKLKLELDETRRVVEETSGKLVQEFTNTASAVAATAPSADAEEPKLLPAVTPPADSAPPAPAETKPAKTGKRAKSAKKPGSKKKHVATRKTRRTRRR